MRDAKLLQQLFLQLAQGLHVPVAIHDGVAHFLGAGCAAEIPVESTVCILDGEVDKMLAAAGRAAEEARENLNGADAAGVLLFDCVCRGMILKDGFRSEIDAVRSVFGDVPVAGFLTYGEIARYRGRFGGWHNATAVVLAVPA